MDLVNVCLLDVAATSGDFSLDLGLLQNVRDLLLLFGLGLRLQSIVDQLGLVLVEPLISLQSSFADLDHLVDQHEKDDHSY